MCWVVGLLGVRNKVRSLLSLSHRTSGNEKMKAKEFGGGRRKDFSFDGCDDPKCFLGR